MHTTLKNILITIGLSIFVTGAMLLIPFKPNDGPKPWQVKVMPDGNIDVFGIHLGKTTYLQAQKLVQEFGKTGLFTQTGHPDTVEAYFQSIHLGGLTAKVVLNIGVSEAQIQRMLQRTIESKLQPSGARLHELALSDRESILHMPIVGITYIPEIHLDKTMLESRFGKPDSIKPDPSDSQTEIWSYSRINLDIYFNDKQKPVLQYHLK